MVNMLCTKCVLILDEFMTIAQNVSLDNSYYNINYKWLISIFRYITNISFIKDITKMKPLWAIGDRTIANATYYEQNEENKIFLIITCRSQNTYGNIHFTLHIYKLFLKNLRVQFNECTTHVLFSLLFKLFKAAGSIYFFKQIHIKIFLYVKII